MTRTRTHVRCAGYLAGSVAPAAALQPRRIAAVAGARMPAWCGGGRAGDCRALAGSVCVARLRGRVPVGGRCAVVRADTETERRQCNVGRAPGAASQRGYSLLEIIVAFAVLALALSLLLGTLSGGTRQVRWAADSGRAVLHAQSLLDEVGVGEVLVPGRRDGDFDGGRYRWVLDVAPYVDPLRPPGQPADPYAPQLLQLRLEVSWGEGGPRERLQLDTLRLVQPDPSGLSG